MPKQLDDAEEERLMTKGVIEGLVRERDELRDTNAMQYGQLQQSRAEVERLRAPAVRACEELTHWERQVICGAPSLATLGDAGVKALRILDGTKSWSDAAGRLLDEWLTVDAAVSNTPKRLLDRVHAHLKGFRNGQ